MKSIFSRLILSFLVIILIVLSSIGILFTGLLRGYLIKQKETELKSKGSQIIELSRRYINKDMDEDTFSYMLTAIDEIVDSRTFVVDKAGMILASSLRSRGRTPSLARGDLKLTSTDIAQILNGSTVVKTGYSPFFEEPMITVGIPISGGGAGSNILGAVILNSPVKGISDTVNKTNTMLIFASLTALAFSLVGAYFLSRTLSKPIHTISKAALEIADGNYSKKVDIKREDEIGSLASSFNYLTERLNETIGDLNNEKTKLSDILHSMEEGLVAVDNNLDVIHINPAAMSMLDTENISGKVLSDVESFEDITSNVKEVLDSGKSKSYDKKASRGRVINILISPLKYQGGDLYGAIILLQDISESVKLEKMRRDFVANVSHELRTPLTSIRGFIEPLIDGTVDDEKTSLKYHTIIRNETLRLERLINDLLDLSRLQSGKITLDIQKVDIVELIANISAKFQPIFNSKNISFDFEKPEDEVFIAADGDRVEQLMVIFIDNAVKYTPRGGKIGIRLIEDDGLVRIAIKDSGIGIPEEDIPYIWERFYKVDKSRTGKSSGTGLGLSIAKNIIELHGQKAEVRSTVGEGTEFEFTMKRYKQPSAGKN
jgi:Signal transduction histidine kinase